MNPNSKVLAVVGGVAITEADIDGAILGMGQRGQQYNNPQGRKMLLEQLIHKQLILMDARKNLMEHEADFKQQLEHIKTELLANYYMEKLMRQVRVTDSELQAYFDGHPEEFQGEESVSASHILVDSEDKALALLEQIRSGDVTFEDAARANSSCPSGQNGGALGQFGHGQMVPEFDEACFAMEVGEIKGPVQTQFGYHLIRLDEKHPAEPVSFQEAKPALEQKLLSEAQQKAYQSKMNQLKILYPVDQMGILS